MLLHFSNSHYCRDFNYVITLWGGVEIHWVLKSSLPTSSTFIICCQSISVAFYWLRNKELGETTMLLEMIMYSEQNKPCFNMKKNGTVSVLYRISPYFIYHPFFPIQNTILLYITKGHSQFESALQITCQVGSNRMTEWLPDSPHQPLTACQFILLAFC